MMLTLVDEPPENEGHEVKHHGYRTIIAIEVHATRAFTRRIRLDKAVPNHRCPGRAAAGRDSHP
jgi:hypothetical protein